MSEPFLAEVRLFGFNFAPRNWAQCDGQILPINQNQSLFSLLGTNYGGDGRTTFALPELRGRMPMHVGSGFSLGQKSGSEQVFLTTTQMPSHTHQVKASSDAADSAVPTDNLLGQATVTDPIYANSAEGPTNLNDNTIANAGSSQPADIMQPFLAVNFCIAVIGLFPSRN